MKGLTFYFRAASDPPMTRRPLQLSARSASSTTSTPGASPPASSSSRASPFGAAKPIDTAAKEREVEEKLAAARPPPAAAAAEKKEGEKRAGQSEGAWVRKGPLAPAAAKPRDVAPPLPPATEKDTPTQQQQGGGAGAKIEKPSLRKEGFSYSNVAGKSDGQAEGEGEGERVASVDEVTKGVEAL